MKKIVGGIVLALGVLLLGDIICIFMFQRPLIYFQKRENIYYGLLYDTYDCQEYSRPQIKRKGLLLACSLENYDLGNEDSYEVVSPLDVKISLEDVSGLGLKMIIKDDSVDGYVYSDLYIIERNADGKWYEVKAIRDDYGFNDIGILLDDNNEVTFKINWVDIYGVLPKEFQYRILKKYKDNTYLAANFTIE